MAKTRRVLLNLDLLHQTSAHKNAAISACDQGSYVESAQHGTQSLTLESEWMCQQAGITRKVLAYSLFGDNPIYCETAILNAQSMPEIYPDWQMWVYHDSSVPEHVLQRLRALQVRVIDVACIQIAHWPGTFWRFHAASDASVAKVQFRDADSLISQREAQWVQLWLDSPQPFHVMRDWYSHLDLMLAGLWGAHAPLLAHMKEWIEQYLQTRSPLHPTHADQIFLAEVIWPKIAPYCLTHDTIHTLPFATPIDSPRPNESGAAALGGCDAKQITVSAPMAQAQYRVTIRDAQGVIVMSYQRQLRHGKDVFELPMRYHERIRSGQWRIDYEILDSTNP